MTTLLLLFFALSPLPGLFFGPPWNALTPVLTFIVFPIFDLLSPKARPEALTNAPRTPLLTYYLPYHAGLVLLGAWTAQSLDVRSFHFWVNAFSVGLVTGAIGITFAHEWVHHLNVRKKLYGEWLLVWVCYGHYAIEHVYGHHKNVATREDGATARKNEWIQTFIPRALIQVWFGSFRIKPKRTLFYGITSILICAGIHFLFGTNGSIFFLIQSGVAILLLTSIDYVEHYGLERKKSNEGRYESMKPWHSWDSDTSLMGELLIRLQRHADHHMHPLKPYTELTLLPEAPKLPTGYAGMIWIAWWPHLWFKIMNPKVDLVNERKP